MTTQIHQAHLLLRSGEARKVGQRSTSMVRYDVTSDADRTKVFIRITSNDGGGYFSKEMIDIDKADECVTSHRDGSPFPSKTLAPAFAGKSSNNAGFLAAVLRAEHLLDAAPGSDFQHVVSGDWSDWKFDALKLEGTPLPIPVQPTPQASDGDANKPLAGRGKGKKRQDEDAAQ